MSKTIDFNEAKKKQTLKKHAYDFAAAKNDTLKDLTYEEKLEIAGTYELQTQIINAMNEYSSTYSMSKANLTIMTRIIGYVMNDVIRIAKDMHGEEFADYLRQVLNEDSDVQ
jgi:hypothetical protein